MNKYHNLDLEAFDYRVDDSAESFRVRVVGSPAGEQKLTDAEEVEVQSDLRDRLRRLDKRRLGLAQMINLGEAIAAFLF